MTSIRLPRVAGSRDLAEALVEEAHISSADNVQVDGRNLVVNTESFAFRIVELVSEASPQSVEFVGGSPEWFKDVKRAADKLQVKFKIGNTSTA
ncbi:hypothetical protein [Paenarthrobacter sp. NPDC090522]|uniref:hypothetical protein n=1 Tax=Paenarthrobacter sp. NPDC090522 TaxID=3364383 RepID=UPI00382D3D7F